MSATRPARAPAVDASTLCAALEIVQPAPAGKRWEAVCTVCRLRAGATGGRRVGGQCGRCDYSGPVTVAVLLPRR